MHFLIRLCGEDEGTQPDGHMRTGVRSNLLVLGANSYKSCTTGQPNT